MDAVTATLAGSIEPARTIIVGQIQELAGAPIATVLGKGSHTSSIWAAYANRTMAYASEYADTR